MKKILLITVTLILSVSLLKAQSDILEVENFDSGGSSGIGTAAPGPDFGAGVAAISYAEQDGNGCVISDFNWSNADWFPRALYYKFTNYQDLTSYPVLHIKFMVLSDNFDSMPVRFDLYGKSLADPSKEDFETNARPWELTATSGEWYDVTDNFQVNNRFACSYYNGNIAESRVDSAQIKGLEAFVMHGKNIYNNNAGTLYIDYISLEAAESSTGIKEIYRNKGNFSLAVYPNPTTDFLNLNAENEITSICVTDFMGKTVQTIKGVNSKKALLNTASLVDGLYIATVIDQKGGSVSRKFQVK